ncbi:MAG: histidine phosphatase family protein [Candidatus Micrarchaeota archaeon]
MVKRIFLVRHGETIGNELDLIQGTMDSALSKKGVEQAKSLSKQFGEEHVDTVYCSDLGRTRQTLEYSGIAKKGVRVVFSSDLRERNYGKLENRAYVSLKPQEKGFLKHSNAKPDGGESIEDLGKRIIPFFDLLLKENDGDETVLIMTHHNVAVAMLCHLCRIPFEKWRLFKYGNAAVSELVFEEEMWRIKRVNDECHLR